MLGLGFLPLIGLGALIIILSYLTGRRAYQRVPPNKVMVIYGRGKTIFNESGNLERTDGVRLITGGGAIIWPYLEAHDYLDLTVITIAVKKDEVYTVDGIPIQLDWVAQVQIAADDNSLLTPARAFLGRDREEVKGVIAQTLSANFRAIVGQLTVEDVHRDRDAFVQRVQDLAADDMKAMGIIVVSMGIDDIKDDQGYFEAMAAPQIALIKRDASIAQAEADRMARVRSAEARREAEQAELDATRAIIEQSEALHLREVKKDKTIRLAEAEADEVVQKRRALVIKEQQEVELLVPARSQREAIEINADADRRRMTIAAEADAAVKLMKAEAEANALRTEAEGEAVAIIKKRRAEADATERHGKADAAKLQALKKAEAEGARALGIANAEATKALLLAEAIGKRELADATAAQNEINLRETVMRLILDAEVQKMQAIGEALKGVGENVRIVQFSGSDGNNVGGNLLLDTLKDIPELATVINAKTEALSGENLGDLFSRLSEMLHPLDQMQVFEPAGDDGEYVK